MRISTCIAFLCVTILGCGWDRDSTEYSLDEKSFDAEAMAKIERETGIDLPDGAKGLKFHHIPPIDPMVFAKIKIPADAQDAVTKQIAKLAVSGVESQKDFASKRCDWWPAAFENVLLSKQALSNGWYVDLYLVKEGEDIILYIMYFTF